MMRLNGPRGIALLFGGAYCFIRTYAYLPLGGPPSTLPGGLELITSIVPLWAWTAVWAAVGVLCVVSAFLRRDHLAWGAVVAMMIAWGVAYLFGWAQSFWTSGDPSREWLNASTYGLPGIMLALLSSRLYGSPRPVEGDGQDDDR